MMDYQAEAERLLPCESDCCETHRVECPVAFRPAVAAALQAAEEQGAESMQWLKDADTKTMQSMSRQLGEHLAELAQLRAEVATIKSAWEHETSLIRKDLAAYVTDCSIPTFQLVRNARAENDKLKLECGELEKRIGDEQERSYFLAWQKATAEVAKLTAERNLLRGDANTMRASWNAACEDITKLTVERDKANTEVVANLNFIQQLKKGHKNDVDAAEAERDEYKQKRLRMSDLASHNLDEREKLLAQVKELTQANSLRDLVESGGLPEANSHADAAIKSHCGTCDGSGVVDSGGVTPWDAPIDMACPECKAKRDAAVVQGLEIAAKKVEYHRHSLGGVSADAFAICADMRDAIAAEIAKRKEELNDK